MPIVWNENLIESAVENQGENSAVNPCKLIPEPKRLKAEFKNLNHCPSEVISEQEHIYTHTQYT